MQQLQAAVALHNQGKLDQAEVVYQQVLAVDANNFYALRFLGCLQSSKGLHHSAISLLRQATTISSCDAECWFNLGNAYKGDSQFEEAIVAYRSAEKYGSVNPQVFNNWGRCLQELSKQKESIPVLEKAVGMDGSCFGAWFALGNSWRDIDEASRAIFCYMKSIEASPSFVDSYLNLGALLQDEGRSEEAIAIYRKVIEVKPDFADAYLNLGNLLREEGKVEEAIASYRKAIEVKPDFVDVYLNLGDVLMDAGRVSESIGAYEKCSQLNPWDPSNQESPARRCDSFWNSSGDLRLRELAVGLYVKSFQIRRPVSGFVFDSKAVVSPPRVDVIAQSLPESAELLPSFESFDGEKGLSLYYLHIPKNGGIRFTVPLQECIRLYEDSLFNGKFDVWRDVIELRHAYKRLTALRLNNKSLHDAFLDSLSSSEPDHGIDWSLVMSHGSWSSLVLQQRIADLTGKMPIRVGAWREPRERFLSALHYLYREAGGSLERVVKDLSDKKPFLHNAIYRYASDCIDGDLKECNAEFAVDCLLDLGDHSLLNQLQSSFLTRNGLPNLIVSKRFNVTKNNFRMTSDDEARLLDEFSIEDFVSMDESEAVNSLRISKLPPGLSCSPSSEELHPLTVIVSDSTKQTSSSYEAEICLTADLAGDCGRQKLQRIFAGKNI